MPIFSNTIRLLENALDYSSAKQKVISQNIANVDTPNYKAKEVLPFRKVLNEELNLIPTKMTNELHIPFSSEETNQGITDHVENVQYNESGNSVDMDKEMVRLAENQIYYNALVDRINGKFNTLRTVIKGGQ